MDALELAALRWAVGAQPAEHLPDVATEALVGGLDSPSLRMLAGVAPDNYWEIKNLFEATLGELGIPVVGEQEALWRLARQVCGQIVDGKLAPSAGAAWIWANVSHGIEREGDFRIFIGLVSELDDHPEARQQLESDIVAAAREILARQEPRRWVRLQARRCQAPLAISSSRDPSPVPPESLAISSELAGSLVRWASDFDATFEAASGNDGFASARAAEDFVERGRVLAAALQHELGGAWHVEYYPEPTRPPGLRLRGP